MTTRPTDEVPEPERSRRFMADPMQWPLLYLPLKKKGTYEVGLMFDERPRVYTINMFELPNYKGKGLDEIPHQDYIDLEGVVDDGWRVD